MRTAAMRAAGLPRGEVKFLPREVRRIGEGGLIEGYASLFGVPDLGRDVVERGAFADSIARRGPAGIRMLCPHAFSANVIPKLANLELMWPSPQHLPQRATRTGADGGEYPG